MKYFNYFSFVSLLVGIAIVKFGAPYLKPLPYLVYPNLKAAYAVYYFSVCLGWASILLGTYSIFSFLRSLREIIRARRRRSCFFKGGDLYLKRTPL